MGFVSPEEEIRAINQAITDLKTILADTTNRNIGAVNAAIDRLSQLVGENVRISFQLQGQTIAFTTGKAGSQLETAQTLLNTARSLIQDKATTETEDTNKRLDETKETSKKTSEENTKQSENLLDELIKRFKESFNNFTSQANEYLNKVKTQAQTFTSQANQFLNDLLVFNLSLIPQSITDLANTIKSVFVFEPEDMLKLVEDLQNLYLKRQLEKLKTGEVLT